VRFVCLNGNERIADQVAWLDSLLARQPARWTIVFMHQPVYSTGKNRDNPKLREALVPLYDKHSVDLVLQGHDHSYGRTHPLRGGVRVRVGAGERGTVYAVSGTGPKFYPVNPQHAALMAKIDSGLQLYQVISVNGPVLRYEAWTATGVLHDSFELKKAAAAAH
jgi:3',5'-cyclic AMP phosphodiesterase CpdA